MFGAPGLTLARLLDDPEEHDFASTERVLADIPSELAVTRPDGWPYSIAEVLAHMNSNVQFNLELIKADDRTTYKNTHEHWPQVLSSEWSRLVDGFLEGMRQLKEIALASSLERVLYPANETEPAWTVGYKLALSVAKHNAYHIGQIAFMRKLLKIE